MLFTLRDQGWAGYMLGIDYSSHSVELARRIETKRREHDPGSGSRSKVDFEECDVLSEAPLGRQSVGRFRVVLDKGTFDAISLSSETDEESWRKVELYRSRIKSLTTFDGIFIITSCNWTEEELRSWLEEEQTSKDGRLVMTDRIPYQPFRFGGQEGQTVVTICFEKAKS
jgi:EEF1A lysine methyltransferase 2